MPFYTYRQNNVGGKFKGPRYVSVEAATAEEADERSGLDFNDWCRDNAACGCGRRWTNMQEDPELGQGTDAPQVYGESLDPASPEVRLVLKSCCLFHATGGEKDRSCGGDVNLPAGEDY